MNLLHLATTDDAEKLLPQVAAFHQEIGLNLDAAQREAAILPLLEGVPFGAIWLIGPRKAPVGYIVVSFGWSVEFGGMDGIIDELYVRPTVRKRGIGSEALSLLSKALKEAGVRALHLEAQQGDETIARFYGRARFIRRDGYALMSRVL